MSDQIDPEQLRQDDIGVRERLRQFCFSHQLMNQAHDSHGFYLDVVAYGCEYMLDCYPDEERRWNANVVRVRRRQDAEASPPRQIRLTKFN